MVSGIIPAEFKIEISRFFFQIWESGGIQELNCTARRVRGRVVQWHDASKNANIR